MSLTNLQTQVITANIITIFILVNLIINFKSKKQPHKHLSILFFLMIILNMSLCIIETITILLDSRGNYIILMFFNTILYIGNISFAVLALFYSYVRVFGYNKFIQNKKYILIMVSPAMIIYIMSIVNIFTPVLFSIDRDTLIYKRHIGFLIAYMIVYGYIITALIMTYKNKNKSSQYLFGSMLMFVYPLFIASVIQFYILGTSVLWIGCALGLSNLYNSIQDEDALIDKLSGLYSRSYMDKYISSSISRNRKGKQFVGIMIDIDKFKLINDSFGHQVGDIAISHTGSILRHIAKKYKGIGVRYAGDEFFIFTTVKNLDIENTIIKDIHDEIAKYNQLSNQPYKLSLSIGYSIYSKYDTTDSFIKRMDTEMYKKKNKKYARNTFASINNL